MDGIYDEWIHQKFASDNYVDMFASSKSFKRNALSAFVVTLMVLLSCGDLLLNVVIIINLWGYFEWLHFSFFVGFTLFAQGLQCVYFYRTDEDYRSKLFPSTLASNSVAKILYLVGIICSLFIPVLPYIRLIEFFIGTKSIDAEMFDRDSWQKLLYSDDQVNQNIHRWLGKLFYKLECFLFRCASETVLQFIILVVLVSVDRNIIINDDNGNGNGNRNGILNYYVVLSSLCIKFLLLMMCGFIYYLGRSHSFEVYTHITDIVGYGCDFGKQIIAFIVVCDCITRLIWNDYQDFHIILLSIYIGLPGLLSIAIVIDGLIEIEGELHEEIDGHHWLWNIPFYICYFTFILPLIGAFGLFATHLYLLSTESLYAMRFITEEFVQEPWFELRRSEINQDFFAWISDSKDPLYKELYNVFNKIAYFLTNDVKCNLFFKKSESKQFHQQMSCINYELLHYCIHVNNPKNLSYRRAKGLLKDMTQFTQDSSKYDPNTDETGTGVVMNSIEKNVYFPSSNGSSPYHTRLPLKEMYEYAWYRSTEFLSFNIYSTNTCKRILSRISVGYFLIWKLNTLLFPLYCLLCYEVSTIINLIDGNQVYVMDVFIVITSIFLLVLYIIALFLSFYVLLPLYYKFCYVLPFQRLSKKVKLVQIENDENKESKQNDEQRKENETENDNENKKEEEEKDEKKDGKDDDVDHPFGEYFSISDTFKKLANGVMSEILLKNILCHCEALRLRPIKEKIVFEYFGKDISPIILEYLPLREHEIGINDSSTIKSQSLLMTHEKEITEP